MARAAYDVEVLVPISLLLRAELDFLLECLRPDLHHLWSAPIAHLIPRTPDFTVYGDSCLASMGGYCRELQFWWYLDFPTVIRRKAISGSMQTSVFDYDSGDYLSINLLEFAAIIVSYSLVSSFDCRDVAGHDYPTVQIFTDNRAACSWVSKAVSTSSATGKAMSLLLCDIQMGNPLGIHAHHVAGEDNSFADAISRFDPSHIDSAFVSFSQQNPSFRGYRRCHLAPEKLSSLWAALSNNVVPQLDVRNRKLRP